MFILLNLDDSHTFIDIIKVKRCLFILFSGCSSIFNSKMEGPIQIKYVAMIDENLVIIRAFCDPKFSTLKNQLCKNHWLLQQNTGSQKGSQVATTNNTTTLLMDDIVNVAGSQWKKGLKPVHRGVQKACFWLISVDIEVRTIKNYQ